jgi:hypothetical protein
MSRAREKAPIDRSYSEASEVPVVRDAVNHDIAVDEKRLAPPARSHHDDRPGCVSGSFMAAAGNHFEGGTVTG